MSREIFLVSACLSGSHCKYSGGDNLDERVAALVDEGLAIPVCPEVIGGLTTPRPSCEQMKDAEGNIKVLRDDGVDVTGPFQLGAEKTLAICQAAGITKAILQKRSPSCGKDWIYDGTFGGKLTEGDGLTARLLMENGIEVFTVDGWDPYVTQYVHQDDN